MPRSLRTRPSGFIRACRSSSTTRGELNRWLWSLPTSGVPAPNSWGAYASDLVAWLRFLVQRNVGLIDDMAMLRDVVAAYHADRRMGDLDRRLAPSSWNRAVAAISRFYDWAYAENLIDAVPFD